MSIGESDILTTKSVNSTVFEEGSDEGFADVHQGDTEPHGHIMLLDWDDLGERNAVSRASDLPGMTLVFESSPGSHHAWNLTVGDLKTTACRMLLQYDDSAHVRTGLKRGYWRLRYTAKEWKAREGQYKDAPELITVTLNETEREQSRPHFKLAQSQWNIPEPPEWFDMVGRSLSTSEYETMTDDAKDVINYDGQHR
jgi:hypothetical protein